jgi:hypothetical protein
MKTSIINGSEVSRLSVAIHGSFGNQPLIVENSIRGAKGQEADSQRYSTERIFVMLAQLAYIDTKTVFSQMSAYNQANLNEKTPSERNVQRMTKVLRCASQGIQYHANTWHKNISDTRTVSAPVLALSDEDRERLRLFVKAGEWAKVSEILKSCEITVREFRCPEMSNIGLFPTTEKRNLQSWTEIIKDVGERYAA